jgi:hypothetical protein
MLLEGGCLVSFQCFFIEENFEVSFCDKHKKAMHVTCEALLGSWLFG